ncbi:MAG TPA: single-stranded-DNA-specific exonuclease RecJ [Candidatus Baltobacteraceae bacterium]|nr:single-stranded-DNA-specific exonuclease RecJ [Candidatus Baltobacteraceae bacterium]
MKRWKMAEEVPVEALEALPGLPRLLASLLWRRGIRTAEAAERFLNPSWERDVHDPYLFLDMRKAVDRLMTAIKDKQKIVVHGDYDADGVSGSVILHATLKALGADVSVYLPHREKDGYGMNAAAVEKMGAEGVKVIVTCDCGISSGKEIALGNTLGIDTIVTDHHTLPEVPPAAYAILHPLREGETYPFRYLTGGGVAFKLCQALWKEGKLPEGREKWLLDMVSISTVADLGALTGENRALVHYGLMVLNKTKRVGLGTLIDGFRRENETLDAQSIGFRIAPRINAAGRMEHADAAFALLTAETEAEALLKAEVLHGHNKDRQAATEIVVAEARRLAASETEGSAIVVAGDGWPAALCGLVASKLVDDYYRPVIALGRIEETPSSQEGAGGVRYVGSGRSVPGFDVTGALRACAEHIVKFGGHPAACGLTIQGDENFAAFKQAFLAHAAKTLDGADLEPFVEIEETAAVHEISVGLIRELRRLEPHGVGNPRPKFLLRNARIASAQPTADGKHLRLTVADEQGGRLKLIGFGFGERIGEVSPGGLVEAVVELELNEWNGRVEPQGRIVDIRTNSPNPLL